MQLLFIFITFFNIYSNWMAAASRTVNFTGEYHNRIPTIVVHKNAPYGSRYFRSIQAAIDYVPSNNNRWIRIRIRPGTYIEKVEIPINKPYIFLEGQDRRITIVTYDGHQRTDLSATFSSCPDNIVVKGITFKNSFNLGAAASNYSGEREIIRGNLKQALAARIYGDKSAFFGCGFLGVQDTLMDVQGRHYFHNCFIEGSIDFIFGSAQSVYEDCWINVNVGELPVGINQGFITAQGRSSPNDPSGFVFLRGTVTGNGQAFLGRAYGPYSRVIFYGTSFSSAIVPQGWQPWHYQGHEQNFMYAEVSCRGPGADKSKRVLWEKNLTPSQLEQFSVSSFINRDGWVSKLPR